MANVKDNRRVHYTKAALRQSLISHLKKKPIDRITVKEICETADLNRGTFYAYYGFRHGLPQGGGRCDDFHPGAYRHQGEV